MRYVCVSDIHGCFDKLQAALQSVNFNKETDTLVSVGDPFDRGPDNIKVLKFLMSCPNRIIIWGNHDWRLMQLLSGYDYSYEADRLNGTLRTMQQFTNLPSPAGLTNRHHAPLNFVNADDIKALLIQYSKEAVYAVEFKDLIITHAWLPYFKWSSMRMVLDPNWRTASDRDWEDCIWASTDECIQNNIFPDKCLLVGHWHAWRLAEQFGNEPRYDPATEFLHTETFILDHKLIAIDGCAVYDKGGQVNVFIYNTEEVPQKFYSTRRYF